MWNEDYLIGEMPDDDETDTEVRFLVDAIGLREGVEVLDVACGAGRHASRLVAVGCDVVGVDSSEYLLRAAAPAPMAAHPCYVRADMRRLPFQQTFDVALCLFASFGLFGDSDNLATMGALADVVRDNGTVVIETWNAIAAADLDGQRNWWRVDGRLYLAEANLDSVAGVVHDRRDVIDMTTHAQQSWTRSTRFYTAPELTIMARASGLRPRQWFGDFDGSPYTASSPRLIAVLEKSSP